MPKKAIVPREARLPSAIPGQQPGRDGSPRAASEAGIAISAPTPRPEQEPADVADRKVGLGLSERGRRRPEVGQRRGPDCSA